MRYFAVALAGLCALVCALVADAQSRQPALIEAKAAVNATWDPSIAGKWTYRSYRNQANVIVNADPDPAVTALDPIYGKGNAGNASAALKAFNLVFGEGIMTFDKPSGNNVTGVLDMGNGYFLDLKGTLQASAGGNYSVELFGYGRAGTPTENWEYDYKASTTPKWPNGIDQVPCLTGTVIRAKPHGTSPAGYVASFVAIKQ
jgi:hypothetical protein